MRTERKTEFSYRDIKTVYTIVFLEKSTSEFKALEGQCVHHSRQVFDTGLKMNLFQEFLFIPLDIFKKSHHNKLIENELEAWFTFLSSDSPEHIIELIEKYPMFRNMYSEVYEMCLNTERVMNMFSKELLEMDRNTVRYMIEEQQEQLEEKQRMLDESQEKLLVKDSELQKKEKENEELRMRLAALERELNRH